MNLTFEELNNFYKNWCKETKRSGGVLIGSSVREFLIELQKYLKENKINKDGNS